MSDDLFRQIQRGILSLDSEEKLHCLLESAIMVQPTYDPIIQYLLSATKLSSPERALFLVKFIFLLGKKDSRFFGAVQQHLSQMILYCYQVVSDRSALRLFISSWLMNNQWRAGAERALAQIRIFENQELLQSVVETLDDTNLMETGLNRPACERRLHSVIDSLNKLHSVVI